MSLSIDLTGRRALVSGVTRGIGAGIAQMLARAGCDLAGCGRSPLQSAAAQEFLATIAAEGRRAVYHAADLSHPAEAARWVAAAIDALGGCDILICNAGRNIFRGAAQCSEEEWAECMQLDLAASWQLAQAARPYLERGRDAVIIIITSNHAYSTIPGCFPYNVAKAGLAALVQSLAIEWGPRIRTVGIAPGFIDTAGNDTWFAGFADPAAERARTERMHPVGRIGTVAEIGALCAFLATPLAGFISGTTILADGGRSALMQDH
ncbi:MAG TPA: SDR family oxidoreductase [Roseiflexaceae bacterium]|nr:SDR family oxidoreductase [Roseiflexaceae bacterium]HMP41376.1 SDR family oxidoreductase [Roseiflexaceae bacterium]